MWPVGAFRLYLFAGCSVRLRPSARDGQLPFSLSLSTFRVVLDESQGRLIKTHTHTLLGFEYNAVWGVIWMNKIHCHKQGRFIMSDIMFLYFSGYAIGLYKSSFLILLSSSSSSKISTTRERERERGWRDWREGKYISNGGGGTLPVFNSPLIHKFTVYTISYLDDASINVSCALLRRSHTQRSQFKKKKKEEIISSNVASVLHVGALHPHHKIHNKRYFHFFFSLLALFFLGMGIGKSRNHVYRSDVLPV